MTYILVDTANTFFRARHVINGDADIKLGMAFHITLNSIRKAWQQFNGSHVIFCLEGRSWRKDYYAPYKRNRSDARAAHTEKEQDEEKIFWEACSLGDIVIIDSLPAYLSHLKMVPGENRTEKVMVFDFIKKDIKGVLKVPGKMLKLKSIN